MEGEQRMAREVKKKGDYLDLYEIRNALAQGNVYGAFFLSHPFFVSLHTHFDCRNRNTAGVSK